MPQAPQRGGTGDSQTMVTLMQMMIADAYRKAQAEEAKGFFGGNSNRTDQLYNEAGATSDRLRPQIDALMSLYGGYQVDPPVLAPPPQIPPNLMSLLDLLGPRLQQGIIGLLD